jgi:hypothetical protein
MVAGKEGGDIMLNWLRGLLSGPGYKLPEETPLSPELTRLADLGCRKAFNQSLKDYMAESESKGVPFSARTLAAMVAFGEAVDERKGKS